MSLKKDIVNILKASPELTDIFNEFAMPPADLIGRNIKPDGPVMDDFDEPGNYGDAEMPMEMLELLQQYAKVQTRGKGSTSIYVDEIWDAIKEWARSRGATV
jgi:hypothetical protein